jgi:hypothetical protein
MSLLETLLGLKIDTFSPKSSPASPASPTTGDAGDAGENVPKRISISEHARRQVAERYPAAIPTGAILVAPRYDGAGKPLASVPKCWCCKTPWTLEQLQELKGKTYAFLEPGCGCLDAPQALACCGVCIEHCQCRVRTDKAGPRKISPDDFGTPLDGGGAQ